MAKKKSIKNNQIVNQNVDSDVSIEQYLESYFWLIIPILSIIYFLLSKYSLGFYQDDEISHFINAKKFWIDPSIILGNWAKPGYKIFLILPSLISYDAVIFLNSIISAVTVYLTYKLIKLYKVEYAYVGALLLAFQPLFFDLSFRSYAEIFTSMLFVLLLISYKKEKYFLTGLISGYVFTVRPETLLLVFVLVLIFIKRKNYLAILSVLIFPVIYNLIGYSVSGDIMYVFNQMIEYSNIDVGGARRGYFHYFKVLIYIISPITLFFLIVGFFGFLYDTKKIKEYLLKYDLLYVIIIITFIAQISAMQRGVNPGSWRYILHIAPLIAIFANVGFVNMIKESKFKVSLGFFGTYFILVLAYYSKTTNGLDLLEVQSYKNFLFSLLIFVLYIVLRGFEKSKFIRAFSFGLIFLNIVFLYNFFEPRKLSEENMIMKQVVDFVSSSELKGKIVYTNHSNFDFYGSQSGLNLQNIRGFNLDTLKIVKTGDVLIWDSHYSYRPEFKIWDVQFDVLHKDTVNYKFIKQFSSGNRFAAFLFQKK